METSNHSHGSDSNPPRGPTESGCHTVPPSPISGSLTVLSLPSSGLVALDRTGSENDLRSGQPCIRNGIAALIRPELQTMKNATRRVQRDVFPTELNLLDNVLTKVQNTEASVISLTQSEPVYRLQAEDFDLLLAFLHQHAQSAQIAFTFIGRIIAKLPTFGPTGKSISEWHRANHFEILSVCFRLEVENFIWELDTAFDFQHGSELLRSLSRNERPSAIVQQPLHGISSSIVRLDHTPQ
ncbi:hypothetical protein C8R43DRAFT_1203193 [Mycena crocata]|nr:hypothetical protein C8R43DRAFT_1203193 [Mycena crocata]